MGFSLRKFVDPVGHHVSKKVKKELGIKFNEEDPFGHMEKVEDKLKDAIGYDFEKYNFKNMWEQLKKNPGRALIGSFDPASTKMWNSILGRDDQPIISQLGGPTKQRYVDYIQAGGDPKAAKKAMQAHQIAATIASIYAGGALGAMVGPMMGGIAGAGAGAGAGAAAGTTAGGLASAIPAGATFTAGLSGAGALGTAAVTAGAAAADEEFPLEIEETPQLISRPRARGWNVGNVPVFGRGYAQGGEVKDGALHMAFGGKSWVGNWGSNQNKGLRLYDLMVPGGTLEHKVGKRELKRRKKALSKQERGGYGDEILTGVKNADRRRALVRAGWYADTPSGTRKGTQGAKGKQGKKYATSLNKDTTFYPPTATAFGGAGPIDYFRRPIIRRDPASYIGGAHGGLMRAAQPRQMKGYH